mgnify:CR=1 FL=1
MIRIHGDLVRCSVDAVDSVTTEIIAAAPGAIVLDFSDSGYIDSSGIALIVGLLGKTRAHGIEVSALGLSPHYRHVFEITRLTTYMKIRDETGADSD